MARKLVKCVFRAARWTSPRSLGLEENRGSLLVVAMPLKAVLLSYTDSASAREVKGSVARRGLCGDVFLVATRKGPHIESLKIDTSVRKSEITFRATLAGLASKDPWNLRVRLSE